MYAILRFLITVIFLSVSSLNLQAEVGGPIAVEIKGEKGAYQLYRGGFPYKVKGVGLGVDQGEPEELMRLLALHGGNAFRTWHVIDREMLDLAHSYGLTVAVCLDMARERHGFDYDDADAVVAQLNEFRQQVEEIKDHPALLFWIIGNELNFDYTNPRVYDAVNDIAKMIHEVDPLHPVTTATAGISVELGRVITARAPALDFLSIQVYGGLFNLKPVLDEIDFDMPVAITEWGTIGHWEVSETEWGAPIELNSQEKAKTYLKGYAEVLQPMQGAVIADFAFLWGQKQERTPTWYGMFTERLERTPPVDALHTIWNGKPPEDRAPEIQHVTLNGSDVWDNVRVAPGSANQAQVMVRDEDPAELIYHWSIRRESTATQAGGDVEEIPAKLPGLIEKGQLGVTQLLAPAEPGAYRLFVDVRDATGAVGHANLPFYVDNLH